MAMSVSEFVSFIEFAIEKEREEKFYRQWLTLYPYMELQNLKFMPFKEYLNRATGGNIDTRPASEIFAEIEEAQKRLKKGENNGHI